VRAVVLTLTGMRNLVIAVAVCCDKLGQLERKRRGQDIDGLRTQVRELEQELGSVDDDH
jgi:hypothetical protein